MYELFLFLDRKLYLKKKNFNKIEVFQNINNKFLLFYKYYFISGLDKSIFFNLNATTFFSKGFSAL
jgi:hypothetical protein